MDNILGKLFESYKNSSSYANDEMEIDISWLKDKLQVSEMDELESQIAYLILENEE